eukprot:1159398-Pelagomonas_calceolata.AAC.24
MAATRQAGGACSVFALLTDLRRGRGTLPCVKWCLEKVKDKEQGGHNMIGLHVWPVRRTAQTGLGPDIWIQTGNVMELWSTWCESAATFNRTFI